MVETDALAQLIADAAKVRLPAPRTRTPLPTPRTRHVVIDLTVPAPRPPIQISDAAADLVAGYDYGA